MDKVYTLRFQTFSDVESINGNIITAHVEYADDLKIYGKFDNSKFISGFVFYHKPDSKTHDIRYCQSIDRQIWFELDNDLLINAIEFHYVTDRYSSYNMKHYKMHIKYIEGRWSMKYTINNKIIIEIGTNKNIFYMSDDTIYSAGLTFNSNTVEQCKFIDLLNWSDKPLIAHKYSTELWANMLESKLLPSTILEKFNLIEKKISSNSVKCVACLTKNIDYIYPCGHPSYCVDCHDKLYNKDKYACPVCRKKGKPVKVFLF